MIALAEPLDSHPATGEELLTLLIAYCHFLTACWEAQEQGLPPGRNPLTLRALLDRGVTGPALIWMLYQAHIDLGDGAPATDAAGPDGRGEGLGEGCSFALTAAGEAFAAWFLERTLAPATESEFEAVLGLLRVGRLTPRYDSEHRLFSWGQHLLKCFRQPSPNQEIVLTAAEELSWAEWFDDPLPPVPSSNAKVRLHDTIKDLNRRQKSRLIHFKGDGTGARVGWELRGCSPSAPPALPHPRD